MSNRTLNGICFAAFSQGHDWFPMGDRFPDGDSGPASPLRKEAKTNPFPPRNMKPEIMLVARSP